MRKVNADLHNHLKTGSDMSNIGFNQVVDLAKERLGAGGILGIVNFADRRYEQFVDKRGYERQDFGNGFYVPGRDILVVKGEEVSTKQGHLLVLGVRKNEHFVHGKPLEETIRDARQMKGIVIADHPFTYIGIGKQLQKVHDIEGVISYPDLLGKLDAIEVHNGEAALLPPNPNKKAQEYYRRMKHLAIRLGALSVSDGHSLREMGMSYTALDMPDRYEITSPHLLVDNLREAIQEHRDFSGKMANARLMALIHLITVAGYISGFKARRVVQLLARKFKK